jgi:hypothetical protein
MRNKIVPQVTRGPSGPGLAIRDTLHPASGRKADHFDGMNEGMLKRLLKEPFR